MRFFDSFTPKLALRIVLSILSLVLLFHLTVMVGIVPYKIVWGFKLHSINQMLVYEWITILITTIIFLVFLIKARLVKTFLPLAIVNFLLWIVFVFYSINTLLILTSGTSIEKGVFTFLSFLMALSTYRLAKEKSFVSWR
jgi:hypothetical protein